MIIRKFTRIILGAALGISVFAFAGNVPETAYAADMSDISVTSTREDVQQVVDDGNFHYTELDGTEIDHIYELYNNDPETIKQLQRQSDYNATGDIATLSARYTHSSMFDGYKVIKGIDVSEWNGDNINWKKVKAAGISYAFIRVGGRYYGSGKYFIDSTYKDNIKNALNAGVDVGVYFYSQAISTSEAKTEAKYTTDLISGYNITYPVVMDYEYAWEDGGLSGRLYNAHLSKSAATNVIKAFCAAVESKGYVGMIYASKTVITDDMNASSIAQSYPIWNAQYNDTDTLTVKHSYWQYSDVGKVSGISNATDMNFRYVKSPAAPSSLTQSACTDSTITLTWTKIPEVYAYQIVRYDSSEDKYVSVGTAKGAGTTTFTDKNLQDGKKYTYKVRGYYKLSSGAIYGTYSAECTGITIADTIDNFAATVTAPTSVKLSWSPIPAATGYRVYRSNGSSGSYETIATTNSPDDCDVTDSQLNPGTKYNYKVRAYTTTDTNTIWHVLSDAKTITTDSGEVTGLKITSAYTSSLTLKWNKQENVDGYIVYVWEPSNATWTRLAKISSKSTDTYTHKGLPHSTEYSYTVCAYYKKNGTYHYTETASAVSGFTGPAVPSQIATASRTAKSVTIRWTQISDATGYTVYKYNTSIKSFEQVARISGSSNRTYTFTGLKAGTEYKFGVRAYTERNGFTGFSDRKDFSSCTLPATFTSSFKYTPLGSQRFLQWSKLSYADGYIVYKYDQKANKYTRVKKITSNKTNFCFVPNLRRGYGYRVLAYMKYNGKIYYGAMSNAPVKNTSLTGTITDSSVNLRAKAGTNSRVVRTLARGSKVKISGYAKSGRYIWYKVTYTRGSRKYTGYIRSDFIRVK